MKIIILTHENNRHFYFCNKIIENNKSVIGVIIGGKYNKKDSSFIRKIYKLIKKKKILTYLKNKFLNFYFKKYGEAFNQEKNKAEQKYFKGSKRKFFKNHKHLLITRVKSKHQSINDPYYVSLIKKKKPNIIIVMGTCLIGKEIINSAQFVINLHTGLSPYFRGGMTNMWPIVKGCPNMFGVTVHEMSLKIDAGKIIYTNQPIINKYDNYGTINCKCIKLGTTMVNKTIKNIKKNSFKSSKQWTKGSLFYNSDWNNYVAYKYFSKKKEIIIRSVKNIHSQSLPKINLVDNGKKIDVSNI